MTFTSAPSFSTNDPLIFVNVTMTPPFLEDELLDGGTFEYFSSDDASMHWGVLAEGGRGANGGGGGRGGTVTMIDDVIDLPANPSIEDILIYTRKHTHINVNATGGSGGAFSSGKGGKGGAGGKVNVQGALASQITANGGQGGFGNQGDAEDFNGAEGGDGGEGGKVRLLGVSPTSRIVANGGKGGQGGSGHQGNRSEPPGRGGKGGEGGKSGTIQGFGYPRALKQGQRIAAGGKGGPGGEGGSGANGYLFQDEPQPPQPGGKGGDGGDAGDSSTDFPASPVPEGGEGGQGGAGGKGVREEPPAENGAQGSQGGMGQPTVVMPTETATLKQDVIWGFCPPVSGSAKAPPGWSHLPHVTSTFAENGHWGVLCDTIFKEFNVYWKKGAEVKVIGMCRYDYGRNRAHYVFDPFEDRILSVIWINQEGGTFPVGWENDACYSNFPDAESDVYFYDAIYNELTIRTYTESVGYVWSFPGLIPHKEAVFFNWTFRTNVAHKIRPPINIPDLLLLFPPGTHPPADPSCFTSAPVSGSTATTSTFAWLSGSSDSGSLGVSLFEMNFRVSFEEAKNSYQALTSLAEMVNASETIQRKGVFAIVTEGTGGGVDTFELVGAMDRNVAFELEGPGTEGMTLIESSDLWEYGVRHRLFFERDSVSAKVRLKWSKTLPNAELQSANPTSSVLTWITVPMEAPLAEEGDQFIYEIAPATQSQLFRLFTP